MSPRLHRRVHPTPRCGAALLALGWLLLAASSRAGESRFERIVELRVQVDSREESARERSQQAAAIETLEGLERDSRGSPLRDPLLWTSASERQQAEQAVDEMGEKMSRRLVAMYKGRFAGRLPALSSARDIQSGLRLAVGLGRVFKSDVQLFTQYREARDLKRQLETERSERRKQRQGDQKQRIERRNFAALQRVRAAREERIAEELRRILPDVERGLRQQAESPAPAPPRLRRGDLLRPAPGRVRVSFGRPIAPEIHSREVRTGIEIAAAEGTPVRAVAAGRVIFADLLHGYATVVIIDHGELVSVSGFLAGCSVGAGESVVAGQRIGSVGEMSYDGAGLYFELRRNGRPVDPESWLE